MTLLQNIDKNFVDVLEIVTDKYNPAFIQSESTSEYDHLNEGIPIDQSKYQKITPERLLSGIPESKYSELLGYLTERYWKFFVPTTPEEGIRKISKVLIPSKKN